MDVSDDEEEMLAANQSDDSESGEQVPLADSLSDEEEEGMKPAENKLKR